MTPDGAAPLPPPPPFSDRWALFLDVDGTLVAFSDHPGQVVVADALVRRLSVLSKAMDGALALVSGRQLSVLDRLFAPLRLPAAGLHGLERRRFGEDSPAAVEPPAALRALKAQAESLLHTYPRAVVEDKGEALGLHWRAMPEAAADMHAFARQALSQLPGYHLQPGDHVLELRPDRADKGTAIAAFLAEPPFRGRIPVFVGDDLTDEHGFDVVQAHGGHAILVGNRAGTVARYRLPDIAAVHAWLGATD